MKPDVAALVACLALAAAGSVQAGPVRGHPIRAASGSGLSITPPSGWRRLERSDGALDFLSPGGRAEGVVIARGRAELLVTQVPGDPGESLARAMRADLANLHVTSRRVLIFATPPAENRCGGADEVEALDDVGPGVRQRVNLLYCRTGASAWRVLVRSWAADDEAMRRRATALAVARSLRTGKSQPSGAATP